MEESKYFNLKLSGSNVKVANLIQEELQRQQNTLSLIASENYVSQAVLDAQGSILTNKYAEGYSGNRYYSGCEVIDKIEELAIDLACQLFGCKYANVQPHSGSQANQAVMLALLESKDTILGMKIDHGGHLTHGSNVNLSGKWLNAVGYGIDSDGYIDMDEVEFLAKQYRPKLIIAGTSSYSRKINWARFRQIADQVGAKLLADIAHFSGLIAGKAYPNPFPYADVVTTTTHKVLRGPRGGLILTNEPAMIKMIDMAVFPGLQGGPLAHVIAAKAVAFQEALDPEFKCYVNAVIDNARVLANALEDYGWKIVSGGTDSHLILLDLVNSANPLTGLAATQILNLVGLVTNKNSIPNDCYPPCITSGLRVGTAAATTRGLGKSEFIKIAGWINEICQASAAQHYVIFSCLRSCKICQDFHCLLPEIKSEVNKQIVSLQPLITKIHNEVKLLCKRFPIYSSQLL